MARLSDVEKVLENLRDQVALLQHSIAQIEAARTKRVKPVVKRTAKKDESAA